MPFYSAGMHLQTMEQHIVLQLKLEKGKFGEKIVDSENEF